MGPVEVSSNSVVMQSPALGQLQPDQELLNTVSSTVAIPAGSGQEGSSGPVETPRVPADESAGPAVKSSPKSQLHSKEPLASSPKSASVVTRGEELPISPSLQSVAAPGDERAGAKDL